MTSSQVADSASRQNSIWQLPEHRWTTVVVVLIGVIVGVGVWAIGGLTPMTDLARVLTGALAFVSALLGALTFTGFKARWQQIVAVAEAVAVIVLGVWVATL